ncbi:MAG: HAD-IIIA family hydrolase [Bacteroidota bacterium]|nr:HAD-IIIA family hydrolase [Bacteroidota bacterium]
MIALRDLNFKEKLKQIRAFVFDIDGVLSKSVVNIQDDGKLIRTTNIKDGFALKRAVEEGYYIGIISGGLNEAVSRRYQSLGVKDVYLGSTDKQADLRHFLDQYKLDHSQILYMGDDLPDYDVMKTVGVATCPADASEEIKGISMFISDKNGGEGCVRDIISQVMKTQNNWYS